MRIKLPEEKPVYFAQRRTMKKFLWLPLIIDNECRWLETAKWVQYATESSNYRSYDGVLYCPHWVNEKWID